MGSACPNDSLEEPCNLSGTRAGNELDAPPSDEPEEQQFDVQTCDGKGLGVVAGTFLKQGVRILSEAPILRIFGRERLQYREDRNNFEETGTVPEAFESFLLSRLQTLAEKDAKAFWSLSDSFSNTSSMGTISACGILATNAMSLAEASIDTGDDEGNSEEDDCAVFARGSRFNHSCMPNVHFAWSASQNKMSFHALRDIEAGEELCICYSAGALVFPAEARQQMLSRWRFQCACRSCSFTDRTRIESDSRRIMLLQEMTALHLRPPPQLPDPEQSKRFMQAIEESWDKFAKDPMDGVQAAFKLSTLLDMELQGHPPSQRLAYSRGYEFAMKAGNKELALELAQAAYMQSRIADRDSSMTRQLEKRLKELNGEDS